jgi:hypothetical protein
MDLQTLEQRNIVVTRILSTDEERQSEQQEMERSRHCNEVTAANVAFAYELVSSAGAAFTLYREPFHTDDDIAKAAAKIKGDRDVVGRIKIVPLPSNHERYDQELPLQDFLRNVMRGAPEPCRNSGLLFRGRTSLDVYDYAATVSGKLPAFEEVGEWAHRFRKVWKCDAMRAILCYVENDIDCTIHSTETGYRKHLAEAAEYYIAH